MFYNIQGVQTLGVHILKKTINYINPHFSIRHLNFVQILLISKSISGHVTGEM